MTIAKYTINLNGISNDTIQIFDDCVFSSLIIDNSGAESLSGYPESLVIQSDLDLSELTHKMTSETSHEATEIHTDYESVEGSTIDSDTHTQTLEANVNNSSSTHREGWDSEVHVIGHGKSAIVEDEPRDLDIDAPEFEVEPTTYIEVLQPEPQAVIPEVPEEYDSSDYDYEEGYYYGEDGELYILYYYPVAVDLDGDGIELSSAADSGVMVDVDNDGSLEHTGWVGADDGLLMFDLNSDGILTDINEIAFANWHEDANTDAEGLRMVFDTNQDGVLSALDDNFDQFGIFQDVNQNGQTDEGEFLSLEDFGITEISLDSNGELSIQEGNIIHGMLEATGKDGKTYQAADVALQYAEVASTTASNDLGAETVEVAAFM